MIVVDKLLILVGDLEIVVVNRIFEFFLEGIPYKLAPIFLFSMRSGFMESSGGHLSASSTLIIESLTLSVRVRRK